MTEQFTRRPSIYTTIIAFLFIVTATLSSGCSTEAPLVLGNGYGNKAPEIVAKDANGETKTLSGHAGSIVLIEFWDSNTSQARRNHLALRQIYNSYKDASFKNAKGFCVFSVSIDTDKQKWETACQEDGINWPCNTIDTNGWNALPIMDYGVHYTPKYLLVDGNGVILDASVTIADLSKLLDAQLDS